MARVGEVLDREMPAVAGVFAAIISTILAVMLMPEDPSASGALFLPALVLGSGILLVPALRALTWSRDLLNAENFVAIGLVYWILLDLIQGAYDLTDVSVSSVRSALVATGVFAGAMWAGVLARAWRMPPFFVSVVARPLQTSTTIKIIPVCLLLGLSNYIYAVNFDIGEMLSYVGQGRWSAPWSRGQLGGWDAFLDHTQYFGYVLPSLAALLVVRRGWASPASLLAVTAAAIQVAFLSQGGGRRIVGVAVGAAILVWALSQRRLRPKTVFGVALSVIALLWTMQLMLEIRSRGYERFVEEGWSYEYLHVDDNFLRLAQVIEIVPAEHPFVYARQPLFAMIRPIPRVFWEGKPVDAGFDLASNLGLHGVSLSTSIVGEWYLSFGWVAVLFGGWLHGRLASAANALRGGAIVSTNPIAFALTVMVLVSGLRSMLDLVVMTYAILAWFAVAYFFVADIRALRIRLAPR